jgi:hypothetical protein
MQHTGIQSWRLREILLVEKLMTPTGASWRLFRDEIPAVAVTDAEQACFTGVMCA